MTATKDKTTYEMDAQCSNCDKTVKISFKKGTVCKGTQLCTNCGCQTAEVKKPEQPKPGLPGLPGPYYFTGFSNECVRVEDLTFKALDNVFI